MDVPFKKTIARMLLNEAVKAINNFIPGEKEKELPGLVEVVIDEVQDCFHATDYPKMMAGFGAIHQGVKTVLASVDQVELAQSLPRAWGAIQQIIAIVLSAFVEAKVPKIAQAELVEEDEEPKQIAALPENDQAPESPDAPPAESEEIA